MMTFLFKYKHHILNMIIIAFGSIPLVLITENGYPFVSVILCLLLGVGTAQFGFQPSKKE